MFKVLVMALAVCAASALTPAQAAEPSPCKGLENAVCAKKDGCRWIASFKTKKGSTVKAYCRKNRPPKPKTKA